jgi:3',5'-cyclic AMP phosphodiesterase CpdA
MHGDLTHESPQLDLPAAERLIDRFLKIWKDHTDLSTFFTFGNHDLVGTKNASVNREDPRFGKGLYRMRLSLDRNFYAFRKGGWRFIVLDDVVPEPDGSKGAQKGCPEGFLVLDLRSNGRFESEYRSYAWKAGV